MKIYSSHIPVSTGRWESRISFCGQEGQGRKQGSFQICGNDMMQPRMGANGGKKSHALRRSITQPCHVINAVGSEPVKQRQNKTVRIERWDDIIKKRRFVQKGAADG